MRNVDKLRSEGMSAIRTSLSSTIEATGISCEFSVFGKARSDLLKTENWSPNADWDELFSPDNLTVM